MLTPAVAAIERDSIPIVQRFPAAAEGFPAQIRKVAIRLVEIHR